MASKRKALLVGCNYEHTDCELRGSINNVLAWREMLMKPRFGFKDDDIMLLTDTKDKYAPATHDTIMAELDKVIDAAKPGDVFFFHFSGHGTLLSSKQTPPSDPGLVAIVPSDFKLITDFNLRDVVDRMPAGASFTVLADCSHSGGLKPAGARFTVLADCSHSGGLIQGEKQQIPIPDKLMVPIQYKPDAGILLSACQADEISNEIPVPVQGQGNRTYGAFTYSVKTVLDGHPAPIRNIDLVLRAGAWIKALINKNQHPCLYCSDENAEAYFLAQPVAQPVAQPMAAAQPESVTA